MKCSECFKKLEKGETIYLSEDMNDHNAYCEECKPKNSFPVLMEKAVPILGRRRGGGEYKEEIHKQKTEIIDGQEVVIKTGEIIENIENIEEVKDKEPEEKIIKPKIEIPDLPEIVEKDVIVKNGVIEFKRYNEIKTTLEENIKVYNSLVMTSDDTEEHKKFKKIRSQLNKDAKVVDDVRIAAKNKLLETYEPFKEKMDALKKIIVDGASGVGSQIDALELELKNKKKQDIEEEFAALQDDYPKVDFIKLDKIFDDKWLNVGKKLKKINLELEELFKNANSDLELIDLETNGARIKTIYMKNGFNFIEAKKSVLASIASEAREQSRIDAAMEENDLVVNKEEVNAIKVKTKEEVKNSKPVVVSSSNTKVSLSFKVTGDKSVVEDIVKYMRGKAVKLEQL